MPFWRHCYHLIWATKNRQPLIQPEFETRLYDYIISKAAELETYVYAINGWYDHVHLIVAIPPTHSVAEVVKMLKGASSHYINHTLQLEEAFGWQAGYGSLTLGEKQRPIAEAYVREQKQHHAEATTNPWLERCEEDTVKSSVMKPSAVHEVQTPYEEELPF
mgnify:CR=1 FL=1